MEPRSLTVSETKTRQAEAVDPREIETALAGLCNKGVHLTMSSLGFALMVIGMLVIGMSPAPAQTRVADATVFIQCRNIETGQQSSGSGVVISEVGHILTAKHILIGEPEKNSCKAQFGTASVDADRDILRRYVVDDYDAAVFQFAARLNEVFEPVEYAPLSPEMEGQDAAAFGYPGGDSPRPIQSNGTIGSIFLGTNGHFATNGLTSQGMSGGPVTFDGKLIGLVSGVEFNALGLPEAYSALAIDAFYDDVAFFFDGEIDQTEELDAFIRSQLASSDPCTSLFKTEVARRYPQFRPASSEAASSAQPSALLDIAPFWVTITTGPATWLNCEAGNLQKAVYFPIGLMVRPVSEITVGTETRTVFQTEHGLRVMIDPSAVAPVTETDGYIFAEGSAVYNLCLSNAKDCNPGADFPLAKAPRDQWPFLTGFQSYLYNPDTAALDDLRREFGAFRTYQDMLNRDPTIAEDPFITPRIPETLDADPACMVSEAMLYRFHKAHDPEAFQANSEYLKPVKYSLCSVGPDGMIRYRRVKIVTPTFAEARFARLWSSITMKNPGENIVEVTRALARSQEPFVSMIDCGEQRLAGKSLRMLATAPLNTGQRATLNDLIRTERAQPPTVARQIHYRPFQTFPALSDVDSMNRMPLFQEMELEVRCDEAHKPERADSLKIYFSPVFGKTPLVLSVTDLNNLYDRMGKYGWSSPEERRQAFGTGVIDRICEYITYVTWREVLGFSLRKHPKILEGAQALNVSTETMADHFAHLIMASVFVTDSTLRTADNPFGGCK